MYQKDKRLCVILIEDGTFRRSRTWVVPSNDSVDTGIRK
jgi:hypothetical protein